MTIVPPIDLAERQVEEDIRLGHEKRRPEPTLNQRVVAALRDQRRDGAEAERNRIVEWLRSEDVAMLVNVGSAIKRSKGPGEKPRAACSALADMLTKEEPTP